jgi:hypothetical protein
MMDVEIQDKADSVANLVGHKLVFHPIGAVAQLGAR